MRKTILAALAALAMAATAAPAATYTVDVTATTYTSVEGTGLRVNALNLLDTGVYAGSTINVTLNAIGESVLIDLFRLAANEAALDIDDYFGKPASVAFTFGTGAATLFGATQASPFAPPSAIATYVADAIEVGGGLRILITLANTTFATNGTSYVNGAAGAGVVRATFTLAAVPVPAAGGLALAGLGALLLAGRRRKAG